MITVLASRYGMNILKYIVDPQVISIAVCMLVAFYLGYCSKYVAIEKIKNYLHIELAEKLVKRNIYVLAVITALWFLLAISSAMFEFSDLDDSIIIFARRISMYLTFAVFLYYLYSIYNKIEFLTFFVFSSLLVSFAITSFDTNELVAKALNKYSFSVHTTKITLYGLVKEIILVCFAFWMVKTISFFLRSYFYTLKKIESNTRELLSKVTEVMLYAIALLTIMNSLGINLTSLTVISGAVGVGIGIGLQKISANFISGVALLMEKTIKVGDLLELQNGVLGRVRHLAARYTLVEGMDGKEIIIPNADLTTSTIINLTHSSHAYRASIKLTITYESDSKKALEIMLKSAKSYPKFSDRLAPNSYVNEFRDEGIELAVNFWIPNILDGLEDIRSEVMLIIISEFRKNNIKFADAHKYNFQ